MKQSQLQEPEQVGLAPANEAFNIKSDQQVLLA